MSLTMSNQSGGSDTSGGVKGGGSKKKVFVAGIGGGIVSAAEFAKQLSGTPGATGATGPTGETETGGTTRVLTPTGTGNCVPEEIKFDSFVDKMNTSYEAFKAVIEKYRPLAKAYLNALGEYTTGKQVLERNISDFQRKIDQLKDRNAKLDQKGLSQEQWLRGVDKWIKNQIAQNSKLITTYENNIKKAQALLAGLKAKFDAAEAAKKEAEEEASARRDETHVAYLAASSQRNVLVDCYIRNNINKTVPQVSDPLDSGFL